MSVASHLRATVFCLMGMTVFAWAAPSGVLDERGGTFGTDGHYRIVNPPSETNAHQQRGTEQPDSDILAGPEAPEPPRSQRGLTHALRADLLRTCREYWQRRVLGNWEDIYLIESISRDGSITVEAYARHAQGDAWTQQIDNTQFVIDDVEPLGDSAYKVSIEVVSNDQLVVGIDDRWQLIDDRWYHLPDDFVNGIVERAKGGVPQAGDD